MHNFKVEHKFVFIECVIVILAVSSRVMTAASWVVFSLPWQTIDRAVNDSSAVGDTRLLSSLSILSPGFFPEHLLNITSSPKGRRSHRYLPQGVLKVVRKLLSLSIPQLHVKQTEILRIC